MADTALPQLIPDKPKIEESELERDYVELPTNLAGNIKLCKQSHDTSYQYFTRFNTQAKRLEEIRNLKSFDAMWRASKRRDRTNQTDQQHDSLSNVPSTSYMRAIRTITAGQRAGLFHGEELPARYDPKPGSNDYSNDEGVRIAEAQNLLLRDGWYKDGMENKLKKSIFYNNKYGRELMSLTWAYETNKRPERVPGYYTKAGKPVESDSENPPEGGSVYGANKKLLDNIQPRESVVGHVRNIHLNQCFSIRPRFNPKYLVAMPKLHSPG